MENHHFQWENPLFQWSFPIAMYKLPEGTYTNSMSHSSWFLKSTAVAMRLMLKQEVIAHQNSDFSWDLTGIMMENGI
jgi:hypothetical protein